MDASAIPGAVCAVHADQPFTFACERCGGFACEQCRAESGGNWCSACAAREGAQELTADAAIRAGFALPIQKLGRLLPFVAIYLVPAVASGIYNMTVVSPKSQRAALQLMGGHPDLESVLHFYGELMGPLLLISVVSMVAANLALACQVQVFADALWNRERTASEQFQAGLRAFPATLGVNFVRGLGGVVLLMFCCAPGIWFFTMFALAAPAVGLGARGFSDALSQSWNLIKPRFWLVLGIDCVGWLVAFGGSAVMGGMSGALKLIGTPGEVAGGALVGAVAALLPLPRYAMETYCYVRLRGRAPATP